MDQGCHLRGAGWHCHHAHCHLAHCHHSNTSRTHCHNTHCHRIHTAISHTLPSHTHCHRIHTAISHTLSSHTHCHRTQCHLTHSLPAPPFPSHILSALHQAWSIRARGFYCHAWCLLPPQLAHPYSYHVTAYYPDPCHSLSPHRSWKPLFLSSWTSTASCQIAPGDRQHSSMT